MPSLSRAQSFAVLLLFIVSGFAGLIYQSIWSHYLGLVLGHAAYAQTLVLTIFMGGMALGAWWASRVSVGWQNVIRAYAMAELLIGIAGLGFHSLFMAYADVSQAEVLPALPSTLVASYQWLSAAMLILPQCVLLGMSFPLMSASLIRANPTRQGEALGGLYFANSIGAAFGAIAATFLLLPAIGMPGAMAMAGGLNIVVAMGAFALSSGSIGHAPALLDRKDINGGDTTGDDGGVDTHTGAAVGRLLLWATAISGAMSFVYEIVWIRMLNQALGTTLHSFELMLTAFILGLALGGLWIRRVASRIRDAIRYAGYVQVLMGVAAMASAPAFAQSFLWVGWLQGQLQATDAGYMWFNIGSAGIALLVMFPAAFFAGMTLPLFTMELLRRGVGERAVGRVYAANTIGSIAGVALAVHVLIPLMGLHLTLLLAALGDAALGFVLLKHGSAGRAQVSVVRPLLLTGIALAIALHHGRPDPVMQASGVFRTGRLIDSTQNEVVFLKDGRTSTVSVLHSPQSGGLSIITNGKPDAAMALSLEATPTGDEPTMIMLGALPLAHHPRPERIGIIGWGSGLSTHTALGSDAVRQVETVEIEAAMIEGSRLFGERVARAFDDPRSIRVIEDARTHFARQSARYDVLVSEPSNPWVSGVASLFTGEFYRFLSQRLNDDGVLVQWLHLYEINDDLLSKMISAMLAEFGDVEVYLSNYADIVLVAGKQRVPPLSMQHLRSPELARELARVGLADADDFAMRRIGGVDLLKAYVRMTGAQGHSDFYPEVALGAPRARFKGESTMLLPSLVDFGLPMLELMGERAPLGREAVPAWDPWNRFGTGRALALNAVDSLLQVEVSQELAGKDASLADTVRKLMTQSGSPIPDDAIQEWSNSLAIVAQRTLGHLPAHDLREVWVDAPWLAQRQSARVEAVMSVYAATAERDVSRMREQALELLEREQPTLDGLMQEQLLFIALLGAIGQGDYDGAMAIDTAWDKRVPSTEEGWQLRRFLRAWIAMQR